MKIYKDIQQWTEEWLELRAGVITGTKLKSVIGSTTVQKTVMYELIAEEFAPLEEQKNTLAMQRWNDLEPIAKAKYIDLTKEKVEEVWFIKKNDFLGLSPDGIIDTQKKLLEDVSHIPEYGKAIEIKCPMHKNFAKYILEDKIPAEYKAQVLQYFLVIDDLQELDFIIYNPDFYIKEAQMKIITITREELEKDLEKAREKIEDFRENWIENIQKLLIDKKQKTDGSK